MTQGSPITSNQVVQSLPQSKVYKTELPNGETVAWVHRFPLIDPNGVRQIAKQNGECNTCLARVAKYSQYVGPNGMLFFQDVQFPTGCQAIDNLHQFIVKNLQKNVKHEMVLVTGGTFGAVELVGPSKKGATGPFYHWSILPDVTTTPGLVNRMTSLWSKTQHSVIDRLSKFLNPGARDTMQIIQKILREGGLERPEYWESTCKWIQGILAKFPMDFAEMTQIQKEELCVYAMVTGNYSAHVHYNYQTAANLLDFMVMDTEQAVAREMDKRSDPRTNQVSQLARAKAAKGVVSKYGVGLTWDGTKFKDDLDIYVDTPWGTISYKNKVLPKGMGKLDFDAGITGNEAEPAENVSLCDEVVGKSVTVSIDNFHRRTSGDIPCSVIITQLGQEDLVIPVIWPKDRKKGDLLHVVTHCFTAVEVKEPEMTEKEMRAVEAQAKEFEDLFGVPTSTIATTQNLLDHGIEVTAWAQTEQKDQGFIKLTSQGALNAFDSLVSKAKAKSVYNGSGKQKGTKPYLSQRLADRDPQTLSELKERLANGQNNLSIHLPDHAPGYITLVETKSDRALAQGKTSICSPCHYEEKARYPIKPTKVGTARLDSSWVPEYDGNVTVQGIANVYGTPFFILKGAILPENPDVLISAGFYPQDLSADGHKHRSKWSFLNTTLRPRVQDSSEPMSGSPAIGTFLTGGNVTVILNGKKIVITTQ